jgi:hypothetical protein
VKCAYVSIGTTTNTLEGTAPANLLDIENCDTRTR